MYWRVVEALIDSVRDVVRRRLCLSDHRPSTDAVAVVVAAAAVVVVVISSTTPCDVPLTTTLHSKNVVS